MQIMKYCSPEFTVTKPAEKTPAEFVLYMPQARSVATPSPPAQSKCWHPC
jgi:hypothetical protein